MLKQKKKALSKGTFLLTILFLLSIVLLPSLLLAANGYEQDSYSTLEAGKTIEGPGFFGGTIVRIDGDILGTAFVTGQDVTINGNIDGDLISMAQKLTINGTVSGNIYGTGQYLTFGGQNSKDVFLAGQYVSIQENASLERDLFAAGQATIMDGSVKRDFHGVGSEVLVGGSIGRNADLEGEVIKIRNTAVITGDLFYKSEREALVESGAQILGKTDWEYIDFTPEEPMEIEKARRSPLGLIARKALGIASALLLWFVVIIWKPELWKNISGKISEQPVKTLGIGAIALIVTPILAALLLVTVIGIPIGILLFIAYGVSLYLAKLITAVFIGSWLAEYFKWPEIHKGFWLVLLGLVILTLLCMIPILRILVRLLITFTGLGAIVAVNSRTKEKEAVPASN